jgi:hypothetical protein
MVIMWNGNCYFCGDSIYSDDEVIIKHGEIAHFCCAEDEWSDDDED